MPNHLAGSSSPYLLQHAGNPVEWYPWGEAALARARREDKAILLSVGYAACHWCHVMAHESFEDAETARLMNERFVNVKVDREERPDIDAIYMQAVQAMTGQGGWPMTVFLTPEGAPFYGGTYYPPTDRHGLPSFRRVLGAVSEAWRDRRAAIDDTAAHLRDVLRGATTTPEVSGRVDAGLLSDAVASIERTFDPRHAGFGRAPKFPPSMVLDFLLRRGVRAAASEVTAIVLQTYEAMMRGGIFDQVGGGLHRYSVDERWLVPHFEKMLYDNALFARLGVHLWQATGDDTLRRAVERTLDWAIREMRDRDGGYYSSLDADSDGEEGAFYLWSAEEFNAELGEHAALLAEYWGVTRAGNFEGRNILSVPLPSSVIAEGAGMTEQALHDVVARGERTLLAARARRHRPATDDKVVASWNGLMIRALAEAARAFDSEAYRGAALSGGLFLAERMIREGRVRRVWRQGELSEHGFLDDQAATALAFLDVYSTTFDGAWVGRAEALARTIGAHFMDEATGLPFDTADDHEALITRPRDVADNALPSGTSLSAELFTRLAEFTGDEHFRERGERIVETLAGPMRAYPSAFGHLLGTADMLVSGSVQVAIVGWQGAEDTRTLCDVLRRRYVPSLVLAGGGPASPADSIALMAGRTMRDGAATTYVCRGFACDAPVSDPAAFGRQLDVAVASASD